MSQPPNAGHAAVIEVAHGRVTGHQGLRFGGIACVPATGGRPARIRVAVRHHSGELAAELREADTMYLPGQTWQLSQIHVSSRTWHATLIRVS